MIESDPFEDFKRQRQIEFLEKKFTKGPGADAEQLGNLVRQSKSKSELASRIEDEMRDFFAQSQEQVQRAIRESDGEDEYAAQELEERVQDEMADFFKLSSERANTILDSVDEDGAGDDADTIVDQLKNVFQQGIAHIADVKERYGVAEEEEADEAERDPLADPSDPAPLASPPTLSAPPSGSLPPLGQPPSALPRKDLPRKDVSHPHHAAPIGDSEPSLPPIAAQAPLPAKLKQGMGDGPDAAEGDERILKRPGLLPGAARKRAASDTEIAELRALKALLIDKGFITEEELEDYVARDL